MSPGPRHGAGSASPPPAPVLRPPPGPALLDGTGSLRWSEQLHPRGWGREMMLRWTGPGAGCRIFSTLMEACPTPAHRSPLFLSAADSPASPASFLSRWIAQPSVRLPSTEWLRGSPCCPIAPRPQFSRAAPRDSRDVPPSPPRPSPHPVCYFFFSRLRQSPLRAGGVCPAGEVHPGSQSLLPSVRGRRATAAPADAL